MPKMLTEEINTERLTLRAFTAEDGPRVVALLNDFAVSKWLAKIPYPFTDKDLRLVNPDGASRWPELAAITLDSDVIGGISSGAHLGYWLGREYWGNGYASEAASAMVTYTFMDRRRTELVSGYFTGNRASGKILERLGFREVDRDMTNCLSRGADVSNVNMALTRDQWEQSK